jgi:hypothetical protein
MARNPYDRRDRGPIRDGMMPGMVASARGFATEDLEALVASAYDRGHGDAVRELTGTLDAEKARVWQEGHDAGVTDGATSALATLNEAIGEAVKPVDDAIYAVAGRRRFARPARLLALPDEWASVRKLRSTTRADLLAVVQQAITALEKIHSRAESDLVTATEDGIPF